jgi:RTX calcium-binding nonapeptide repeat (4 copies)
MRHTRRIVALGAVLAAGALGALPALASAANDSTCTFDPATHQVTIVHNALLGRLVLSQDYNILFREPNALGPGTNSYCRAPSGALANVYNTDKITVKAKSPEYWQEVVIDESNGGFKPGYSNEADLREIEFTLLTGSGGDHLTVLDKNSGTQEISARTLTLPLAQGPEIDLNGDGDYDLAMTAAGLVKVFGSDQDDAINGSQVWSFPLELHGGGGNDWLRGGGKSDTIYGDSGGDGLRGEGGDDVLEAADGIADYLVDGGAGDDSADVDQNDYTINVEHPF